MKWVLEKQAEDLFDGAAIRTRWAEMRMGRYSFEADGVRQVEGVFVTSGGRFEYRTEMQNGTYYIDHIRYARTEVQLRPDFEALHAFEPKIPNGTQVRVTNEPGRLLEWHAGRIVPMSPEGRALLKIERWKAWLGNQIREVAESIQADREYEKIRHGEGTKPAQ